MRTGVENPAFKHGKYSKEYIENHSCSDCGIKISHNAIRCRSCASKIKWSKKEKIILVCEFCNKNFKVQNCKKNKAKFCSKKCKDSSLVGKAVDHKIDCGCSACKASRGEYIGKDNPFYKNGSTDLAFNIRHLQNSVIWREEVFKRDCYICMDCFHRGGKLEAHHIKPFAKLLDEFLQKYNQFSPIEDKEVLIRLAIKHEPFWDISNGETLCEDCHKKVGKEIKK